MIHYSLNGSYYCYLLMCRTRCKYHPIDLSSLLLHIYTKGVLWSIILSNKSDIVKRHSLLSLTIILRIFSRVFHPHCFEGFPQGTSYVMVEWFYVYECFNCFQLFSISTLKFFNIKAQHICTKNSNFITIDVLLFILKLSYTANELWVAIKLVSLFISDVNQCHYLHTTCSTYPCINPYELFIAWSIMSCMYCLLCICRNIIWTYNKIA